MRSVKDGGNKMSKIVSLNDAINRLDKLMLQAGTQDEELRNYVLALYAEKQGLVQKLTKLRQTSAKQDTTSSMHSKLSDALRE